MTKISPMLIVLLMHVFTAAAVAQSSGDSSLVTYLNQVKQIYETGSQEQLKRLFTDPKQTDLITWIDKYEVSRESITVQVIKATQDSATVLMFCQASAPLASTVTAFQAGLSGFYTLRKEQTWQLVDKIPIDRANRIRQQTLYMVIDPGVTVQVVDTLLVDMVDPLGFQMTLNSKAIVAQVHLNGQEVDFSFQSGLLWIDKINIQQGKLVVTYSLEADAFNMPEYTRFAEEYGYLRQNYWHPMLKYGSTHDIADFFIHVQIPADYQLTTSFPVTSQVRNGNRYIASQSTYPTADLALLYDKEWEVTARSYPPMTFEFFATSDYTPSKEKVFEEMRKINDLLVSKFSSSSGNYFAAVQSRLLKGSYWSAKTNSIFISAENGGAPTIQDPIPRAIVAHEISHAWTQPTGKARLFLMEGWATFVESYFLQEAYGDSVVHAFWQRQKNQYLEHFDGKMSLWEDETNSNVSYFKGAWVLKILRDMLGEAMFEQGFKNYIQNTINEAKDIHAFSESMSAAAGYDLWPMLETWLKSQHIPEVKAQMRNGQLIVEQTGDDIFHFPLAIQLETAQDTTTQTYIIDKEINRFPLENAEAVTQILIDPQQEMLLTVGVNDFK